MARKKISARASAGTLTGDEIIPIVRLNVVDPNLVTTAQAIADLAGGNSIISNTVEDMQTLANSGDFDPGAFYLVTDAGVSDIGFLCQAISASALSPSGSAGFYVPDFQAAGDYSGVSGFGQQRGVWIGANEGDYSAGDVVIWNGRHYKYVGGGDGVTTPETGNYELLAKSLTNGYIIEWDSAKYDLGNNWIWQRKCKRGNLWEQSFVGYDTVGFPMTSFQWGNNNVYDNSMVNGQIPCLNQTGAVYQNITSGEAALLLDSNSGSVFWNVVTNEAYLSALDNSGVIRGCNVQGGSGAFTLTGNSGNVFFNFIHGCGISLVDNSAGFSYNSFLGANTCSITGNSAPFQRCNVESGASFVLTNNSGEFARVSFKTGASVIGDGNASAVINCVFSDGREVDLTGSSATIQGVTYLSRINVTSFISAQSADFTASDAPNGTKFTNTGAAGFITATLGDSAIDTEYTFCPDPDNGFNIGILTTAGIQAVVGNVGTFTDSILGFVASGGSVTFTKITATTWLCTSAIGTIALD